MSGPRDTGMTARRLPAETAILQLLFASFQFFMSRLLDPAGDPLVVAAHHKDWAKLFLKGDRIVLLAPRDHGKSIFVLAFVLWRSGATAATPRPASRCRARPALSGGSVLGHAPAKVAVARFKDLIVANEGLFGTCRPPGDTRRRDGPGQAATSGCPTGRNSTPRSTGLAPAACTPTSSSWTMS